MKRAGHIHIHGRALKPPSLARTQNRTAADVWPLFHKHHSFLLADPVGAGKSYIALSLALGLWRSAPRRRTPFRLLVIASTTELSDSWLQKLAGPVDREPKGIGHLAQRPRSGSFIHTYLDRALPKPHSDVVIYQLRHRHDVGRLRLEILDAEEEGDADKIELRPRTVTDTSRIEILVTSPRWALMHLLGSRAKADTAWRSWLSRADAMIADEVFSAKNPSSRYGVLLRPWAVRDGRHALHPWRGKRPRLLGLSATLLSRDLSDAKEIFEIAIRWRPKSRAQDALMGTIGDQLPNFSKALRNGLRATGAAITQWQREYDAARRGLEQSLANVITRNLIQKNRQHLFWAVARRQADSAPAHRVTEFPIGGTIDPVLARLRDQFIGSSGATDSLAWYMREWSARRALQKSDAVTTWTAFGESAPGATPNPKLASLQEWLQNAYQERERDWLSPRLAKSPRFKILIYVQHLRTAGQLNPRSRHKDNFGHRIQNVLGRSMLHTCRQVASRSSHLFIDGKLETPKLNLAKILDKHGWSIERLIESDRTLLLAALVNANKGRLTSEKLRRIGHTLEGSLGDRRLALYRSVLRRQLGLRQAVLMEFGRQDLLDLENQCRRSGKKLAVAPSSALLDPEVVGLPPRYRNRLLDSFTFALRGRTQELMFGAEGSEVIDKLAALLITTIRANHPWRQRIEEFRPTAKGFAFLKHRTEGRHWSPHVLAVQTGADSKSRTYILERFRNPGNPFVLILTNVGTVGVDLHPFCWDIAHYTPDWTPHVAEQKIGRIDRPRSPQAQNQLQIGKSVGNIAVHQLVWPYTYDEKILGRLNLRAQLAERLLGSKHQLALEERREGNVSETASRFRPINLARIRTSARGRRR